MGNINEREPVLVILAAGMGSRYGSAKQIDPIDEEGHIIIDYSVFDAIQAGFKKVVFVIKEEMKADMEKIIGERVSPFIKVEYAFQRLDDIPNGYVVPSERKKPWGTGHAVLSARGYIDAPFVVINADDFYGKAAYKQIYDKLCEVKQSKANQFYMVGFRLKNTLTENGAVSRGVCEVDADNNIISITERVGIKKTETGAAYLEDDGETWVELSCDKFVSMNFWGFCASFTADLSTGFEEFLKNDVPKNELKSEFFIPFAVDNLIAKGKASVTLLESEELWYGVTYKEDKADVVRAIKQMKEDGLYPKYLWAK